MLGRDSPVWYDEPRVLLTRWNEFFPARGQTSAERVNSLVRFSAYAAIALYMYRRDPQVLAMGVAIIAVLTLAYRAKPSEPMTAGDTPDKTVEGPFGPQAVWVPPPPDTAADECQLPSVNNPFGNFMLTDYADRPNRPAACEYDLVKDSIRTDFNAGLPRNVADVYERENSQRQFYSMPNTRALPDTKAFAQFLYGTGPGCKQDPSKCTGYN